MLKALIASSLLMLVCLDTHAEVQVFKSGKARIGLLELYTSEGCSSCPPADRWLSKLTQSDELWRRWVPVAFHVDYWDELGWPDRFASSAFSQRQRRYARQGSLSSVYTPGFVFDGREWRLRHGIPGTQSSDQNGAGQILLKLADGQAQIQYLPSMQSDRPVIASVAILGFNLSTQVIRGENRGRNLRHDFVVLSLQEQPLARHDGRLTGSVQLSERKIESERMAIAAWVSQAPTLAPLQAVGGWLTSIP